ncbi:MAG TPA: metallophosphoesterase [Solirubrobacteraceae bacterium]|nr:metallophosphoesterase [Solirubrobacteraceae bacterium]
MDSSSTLVISDLHLGKHDAADVLRRGAAREPLLHALGDHGRLVILGDLLELRHGPLREALQAATGPLHAVGQALGPDGEVVITAGNHDHYLVHGWSERRAAGASPPALGLESEVDWVAGEPLAHIAELLSPARVRVTYPGVWLRDDVYAIHGHYLDLHMTVPTLERLGAGLMRRVVDLDDARPTCAEDYEAALVPLYASIHAIAQLAEPTRSHMLHGGSVRGWNALTGPGRRTLRRRAITMAWPLAVAGLNRARLGPFRPELSGPELRRAGLRAMSEVVARLGAETGHVLFGHTHRAGPAPADDPAEWCTVAGTRLINTGCWVDEPSFLGPDPARSPYRAGFGVLIDDDGPPRLVNLLDG